MRRRNGTSDDAFANLGLEPTASVEAILEARRKLAKQRHPDAGGSVEAMQQLNVAVEQALAAAGSNRDSVQTPARHSSQPGQRRRSPTAPTGGGVRQDHPSFTIEALPAEAFEALLMVAAELGEVADDDPPYLLEAVLAPPLSAWCRMELVPDAGAVTVSITTARIPGHATPDVHEVRDAWIESLNRLDWGDLDSSPRP